jgi:hypothetical protein
MKEELEALMSLKIAISSIMQTWQVNKSQIILWPLQKKAHLLDHMSRQTYKSQKMGRKKSKLT